MASIVTLRCSRVSSAKALHVSPFMGMDHRYEARAATPAQTLSVHISSCRAGVTVFDATLALRRRELTRASIAGINVRYPLATMRVSGADLCACAGAEARGAARPPPSAGGTGMSTSLARRLVSILLRRITVGSLLVVEGDERRVYGSGAPAATIWIDSPRTWPKLLHGSRRGGRGLCPRPLGLARFDRFDQTRRAQRRRPRPAALVARAGAVAAAARRSAFAPQHQAPAPARHRRALPTSATSCSRECSIRR